MGRGYSGNHPRFSKRGDERYDAKEAYNKDLTASARLHYLENDRHDHDSPAHAHNKSHRLRERAINISERSGAERGDEYDYENPRVMKLVNKANKLDERSGRKKGNDERSGEMRNKMIDEMIDDRPDSPMNNLKGPVKDRVIKNEFVDNFIIGATAGGFNPQPPIPERINRGKGVIPMPNNTKLDNPEPPREFFENRGKGVIPMPKNRKEILPSYDVEFTRLPNPGLQSPVNACAKSEGGSGCVKKMGGAWRVISNKTDKPWPAKYASKAKADAALRGYHAG